MYQLRILSLGLLVSCIQAEFPSGKLKEILLENTVDVEPEQLVGSWTTVYESMYITQVCPSSYTDFELQKDNTLKVVSYCYNEESFKDESKRNAGLEIIRKKVDGDKKGIFTNIPEDPSVTRTLNTYVFYIDDNVQGYYSCSPDENKIAVLSGWDVSISVKAEKKAEFLSKTGGKLNDVQLSVYKAIQKLLEIKHDQDVYLKSADQMFGLIGPTYFLDLAILRP